MSCCVPTLIAIHSHPTSPHTHVHNPPIPILIPIPFPFPFPFPSVPYNQTQSLRRMRNALPTHRLQLLRVSFSGFTIYDIYAIRYMVTPYTTTTTILCVVYVIKCCSYLIYLGDNLIDIKLIPEISWYIWSVHAYVYVYVHIYPLYICICFQLKFNLRAKP